MNRQEAFNLLGLTVNCDVATARLAWKARVIQSHPDRFVQLGPVEYSRAQEETKRINRAFAVVSKCIKSTETDSGRKAEQMSSSESLLRKTTQQIAKAEATISRWRRQLARSRTALADIRRLTADAYTNHKEFLVLRASLLAIQKKRDRRVQKVIASFVSLPTPQRTVSTNGGDKNRKIAHLSLGDVMPSSPTELAKMLGEIQEVGQEALVQFEQLFRRFGNLEKERDGLAVRMKEQHRNLKRSIAPFSTVAREGRSQLDEAFASWEQLQQALLVEARSKRIEKQILKSRTRQLEAYFRSLEELAEAQLEGDAAEAVYATINDKQAVSHEMGETTQDQTNHVVVESRALFETVFQEHKTFTQFVMSDFEARLHTFYS